MNTGVSPIVLQLLLRIRIVGALPNLLEEFSFGFDLLKITVGGGLMLKAEYEAKHSIGYFQILSQEGSVMFGAASNIALQLIDPDLGKVLAEGRTNPAGRWIFRASKISPPLPNLCFQLTPGENALF